MKLEKLILKPIKINDKKPKHQNQNLLTEE